MNISAKAKKKMAERKHSHYFKPVPAGVTHIDVYRLLAMFNVTDQAIGHAVKKLLVAGGRGAGKDERKDIQEAIDTLQRKLEMMDEDNTDVVTADVVTPDQDGWIKFTGDKCPVDPNWIIQARLQDGSVTGYREAGRFTWSDAACVSPIVAYRGR